MVTGRGGGTVGATVGAAVGGPAGGPVGGDAAQQAARAELSHREYHHDQPGLLSRVLHWIGRHLGNALGGSGGAGGHALLIVLVVVLALAILLALRAGMPRLRRPDATPDADVDPLAAVPARDHRRVAEQLTAEGRHAEALREWLRAAVATIEERGVLPPRPGRTGAATAREAGRLLPSAAAHLQAGTKAFDEVWFGSRLATATDVAHARAAADAVRTGRVLLDATPAGLAVPR
jgi:hypothetical protein